MHFDIADASNVLTNFLGTSYILSIAMGYLADTVIGRYKVIFISAIVEMMVSWLVDCSLVMFIGRLSRINSSLQVSLVWVKNMSLVSHDTLMGDDVNNLKNSIKQIYLDSPILEASFMTSFFVISQLDQIYLAQ